MGLCDLEGHRWEAAEELGKLLDERIERDKRRHRRQALVTALVVFGSAAGGILWFAQDNTRVSALREAILEIRSAGDLKAITDKYHEALNGISERGRQIDIATSDMGIDSAMNHGEDIHMEAEMRQMIGEDGGRTVGERNKLLAGQTAISPKIASDMPGQTVTDGAARLPKEVPSSR